QISNQQLAPKHFAGSPPHGQQAFGHLLDFLAIDDDNRQRRQGGGQSGAAQTRWEQRTQTACQLGEEGRSQGQGNAAEFAVDGPLLGAELLILDGGDDGRTSAAVVACQSVGNDVDQFGEGELLFMAVAAMLLENRVQEILGGQKTPE